MIQAAATYDEMQKSIAILENQLHRAVAALEAKKVEIDNLNLLLSQERNRNDNHRNERAQLRHAAIRRASSWVSSFALLIEA